MPEDEESWEVDTLMECITEVPQAESREIGWKRWRLPASATFCTMALLLMIGWTLQRREMERIDVTEAVSKELLERFATNGTHLEDWDQKWISHAVEHAKGLHPERPLRSLKEIFYSEISETSDDYPFIRTECVIDTVQATTYLMEAIVNLYRAIDQRGKSPKRCADSDVGCAVNVAGFITCITWVSAYLSLAASSCAQAVNPSALCSADWLIITGAFGEIATAGAAVGTDCDIPWRAGPWAARFFPALGQIGITTTRRPYLKYFPGVRLLKNSTSSPIGGGGPPPQRHPPPRRTAKLPPPILDTVYKVQALNRARTERKFDLVACVADAFQAASFLIRALLQIRDAAQACPDPRNCAIDIMDVISSFSWISHFSVQSVDDCGKQSSQEARCGAEISAMIASITMSPAAGYATTSDCAANPDPKYELLHEPTR